MSTQKNLIVSTYYIQGMHCASCEILIEKKLIKEDSIEMVDAHLANGTVVIEHHKDDKINPNYLNKIFSEDGYKFSLQPFKKTKKSINGSCAMPQKEQKSPLNSFLFAAVIIIGFLLLNKAGLASLVSVSSSSSLPVFAVFGLLAGFSTCAALVGGIILSISKQWIGAYGNSDSITEKLQPHFLFNVGRVGGYAVFGYLLGYIGNFFRLSPTFTALLIIAISVLMVILGLQMLGVAAVKNFQIKLPKSFTGKVADESNFQGRFAPVVMGALTFFLPCGFTLTTEALALASGNPMSGALMMGAFALGTVPGLLAIGYSSVKFQSNPKTASQFSAIAGYLVLFFAFFNVNSQLTVLGLPNFTDVLAASTTRTTQTIGTTAGNLAPIVNGKQVLTMTASSGGYSPNALTVKAGVPVSWQITGENDMGCAGSIVSKGLFPDTVYLTPGSVTTKEFTPTTPGTYRFSCGMGMYRGTITVVDQNSQAKADSGSPDKTVVESGAKGCGCGGGGGSACGGR